jgi:hypothetical protein
MIIPGFSQVIRRSLLGYSKLHPRSLDVYCPTDSMPHDQWFVFLASVFGSISYLPDQLAQYRQHDQNTSGWLPSRPLMYAAHSIRHARFYARSLSIAIANRLQLLAELKCQYPDDGRIDAAIDHYQAIQERVELRRKLYTAPSASGRVRSSLWSRRAPTRTRLRPSE